MQYNKNCPLVLYSYRFYFNHNIFSQPTGELQRKIGLKVLDAGGNAVIGFVWIFLKFVFGDQFICIIYNNIRSSLDGLLIIETASQWGLHCLMFNLGCLYCEVQSTLFIADTEGPQVRVHITESRK